MTALAILVALLAVEPTAPRLPEPLQIEHIAQAFQRYEVVLRPDTIAPEWWAGAPSVVRDADGIFWMACRMRTGEGQRGLRGYELRILKSEDGLEFDEVLRIPRDAVPIPGFERPALLIDPTTNKFKLYACGPWKDGPWQIIKFDDVGDPATFDPKSARPVIGPIPKKYERDQPPVEYKDPVIIHTRGQYHCFVIGYLRQNERTFHFTSPDGEEWTPRGDHYSPALDLAGWHNFFTRPAAIVPLGIGCLFVYEGAHSSWYDPVYNIATGLAWTFDLETFTDLTPDAPLLISQTPNESLATFRYSSWLRVNGEFFIYAEVACPDKTHEIRVYRIPL